MKFGVRSKADDDDPVIATYNVYASPSLQNHLHIFQYPLRRKLRPYEASDVRLFATEGVSGATDKSQSQSPSDTSAGDGSILTHRSRLTMHCRLDTFGSSSFDESKPSSSSPSPSPSSPSPTSSSSPARRHSYAYALQSHPFSPRCDYAVGLVAGGAVHLTPVSTVQQFSPAVRPGAPSAAHRVAGAFASAASAPLVPGLALSDRIQRDLTRQRSAVLNADAATAKEIDAFGVSAVESVALRRRLRSATVEAPAPLSESAGRISPARAEDSLFPPELLISGGIAGTAAKGSQMLRKYAERQSAAAQIRAQMAARQVATLAELRTAVVPRASDETLLAALRSEAVWAHGVWMAKRAANFTGAVAALREMTLLRFFKSPNKCVARAQLNALVGSAPLRRAVREVLSGIAELVAGETDPARRVWRLRLVPGDGDGDSSDAYAKEIAFQRSQWARVEPLIEAHAAAVHAGVPVARLIFGEQEHAAVSAAAPAQAAPVRDEDIAPIVRFVQRLFHEHGVINKQRAKEMVLKAKPRHFPDATNGMLSAALQQSVQSFTSATWVLKTRGEPEVDRHRPLILEAVLELSNFETRSLHALLAEKRERLGLTEKEDEEAMQKIVSRVLAEVAEFKTHERLWRLKSGNVVTE